MMRHFTSLLALSLCFFITPLIMPPSVNAGEVRFGNNVRVGGHDFSNRTYNEKNRGRIYLYHKTPKNEGCRWVKERDKNGKLTGRKTQLCHLQKK